MTTSDPAWADPALLSFVQDHREELESIAESDRQTARLAEAFLTYADYAGDTDEEAEG